MSAPTTGYTKKQAERLKARISRDMAAIEDDVYTMLRRVSDHNVSADIELEVIRACSYELEQIIDRRTRS